MNTQEKPVAVLQKIGTCRVISPLAAYSDRKLWEMLRKDDFGDIDDGFARCVQRELQRRGYRPTDNPWPTPH